MKLNLLAILFSGYVLGMASNTFCDTASKQKIHEIEKVISQSTSPASDKEHFTGHDAIDGTFRRQLQEWVIELAPKFGITTNVPVLEVVGFNNVAMNTLVGAIYYDPALIGNFSKAGWKYILCHELAHLADWRLGSYKNEMVRYMFEAIPLSLFPYAMIGFDEYIKQAKRDALNLSDADQQIKVLKTIRSRETIAHYVVVAWLGWLTTFAFRLLYTTRQHEYLADREGLEVGRNVEAALETMGKFEQFNPLSETILENLEASSVGRFFRPLVKGIITILSTHPLPEDRIAALKKHGVEIGLTPEETQEIVEAIAADRS